MKLQAFVPRGYRNLGNLRVAFAAEDAPAPASGCSIRFLVGRNGMGKSNLLRFLAGVFAALDEQYSLARDSNPAYTAPFALRYTLRGRKITVRSRGEGRRGVSVEVIGATGQPEIYAGDEIPAWDLIGPQTLLIYTSGDLTTWRALLVPPSDAGAAEGEPQPLPTAILPEEEEDTESMSVSSEETSEIEDTEDEATERDRKNEFPNSADTETEIAERIFLIEPEHMPFALLAALLRHEVQQARRADGRQVGGPDFGLVLRHVGLRGWIAFSLRLATDTESLGSLSRAQRRWLGQLYDEATQALKQGRDEQLWVFERHDAREGQDSAARLLHDRPQDNFERAYPFQFFRALVALHELGILQELNLVALKADPADADARPFALLAAELSDGERAFLERMALFHLLDTPECLFLLDEPETHFNDAWKRDLVNQIELTLQDTASEVVLTTHESVTLTDAFPDEVILLTPHGQGSVPLTLGAEPGEILRALFEAEDSVGERAVRRIKRELADKNSNLTDLLHQVGPGHYRYEIAEELDRRAPSGSAD